MLGSRSAISKPSVVICFWCRRTCWQLVEAYLLFLIIVEESNATKEEIRDNEK